MSILAGIESATIKGAELALTAISGMTLLTTLFVMAGIAALLIQNN